MIAFGLPDAEWIRSTFYLAVRVVAALGGFGVGYFLTAPVVTLLYRLVFRKPMPQWSLAWCKVLGGVLVALLVFWLVQIGGGGPGGGGKGSGGGTGDGQGTGTGQTAKYLGAGSAKGPEENGVLVIEILGPDTAVKPNLYLINRQQPAVDFKFVKAYLEQHRKRIKAMQLVFTPQSVTQSDPNWVDPLVDLAQAQGLDRPEMKTVAGKKE